MNDRRRFMMTRLALCLGAVLATPLALGADTQFFYDDAEVIAVSPITSSVRVPVSREECTDVGIRSGTELASGDVRAQTPDVSLADALRADLAARRRPPETRCRTVRRYEPEERIVSYEVTYRYRDDTYVRRMSHHPGEFVRVRVRLDPVASR